MTAARRLLTGESSRLWWVGVLGGGAAYGAVMGSFSARLDERALQVLYSAIKVPLLLLATAGLALPSFFVLNALAGLRADFRAAVRAVAGTQGAVGVLLAALAPYPAVWYASTGNYHAATLFNAAMFAVASAAAQRVLRRRYAELEAARPRHRLMRRVWVFLYAFVGIQMGWVLRPFVGDPDRAPSFFRDGAWGNAYVVVAEIAWQAVTRR